jgi:hypothetical protein
MSGKKPAECECEQLKHLEKLNDDFYTFLMKNKDNFAPGEFVYYTIALCFDALMQCRKDTPDENFIGLAKEALEYAKKNLLGGQNAKR